MTDLRKEAETIIRETLQKAEPQRLIAKALEKQLTEERIFLVAIGKAAWQMASAAHQVLGDRIMRGFVVTKYHHSKGPIADFEIYEAGHPFPDENSAKAAEAVLKATENLTQKDTVLFLVSGGGSAVFEKPLIPLDELQDITKQLLASGAEIAEINAIRKKLSAVKGGKFAQKCAPAAVHCIILSDVLGNPLDAIASGPAYPDTVTAKEAQEIVHRYRLNVSDEAKALLYAQPVTKLANVQTTVAGSVKELCAAAAESCEKLGYRAEILTDCLSCEAKEAGAFLAAVAAYQRKKGRALALIAGGETVVHLKGNGKGGRNQEIALAAAQGIAGFEDTAVFSLGSDGTDGPTDAAGGYADGSTCRRLQEKKISVYDALEANDSYTALEKVDGLLCTGPTGTNLNDISVILIHPQQ